MYPHKWKNAYLRVKDERVSRALRWVNLLSRLHFAVCKISQKIFGFSLLTKSWIRWWLMSWNRLCSSHDQNTSKKLSIKRSGVQAHCLQCEDPLELFATHGKDTMFLLLFTLLSTAGAQRWDGLKGNENAQSYCICFSNFSRFCRDLVPKLSLIFKFYQDQNIWGIHCMQARKHTSEGYTLALKPGQTSPEVQNRGISAHPPPKRLMSSKIYLKN